MTQICTRRGWFSVPSQLISLAHCAADRALGEPMALVPRHAPGPVQRGRYPCKPGSGGQVLGSWMKRRSGHQRSRWRASFGWPGPDSSLTTPRRPAMVISRASAVPRTSDPIPAENPRSVATSRRPR